MYSQLDLPLTFKNSDCGEMYLCPSCNQAPRRYWYQEYYFACCSIVAGGSYYLDTASLLWNSTVEEICNNFTSL